MIRRSFLLVLPLFLMIQCTDPVGMDDEMVPTGPVVKFKFQFNPDQERLGNLGQASTMPDDHAALIPEFNGMSVHFIEFVENEWTPYKGGQFIYQGAEVPANNPNPFDFILILESRVLLLFIFCHYSH